VTDIDFDLPVDEETATMLHVRNRDGVADEIVLRKNDYVFITNDSIVEATDNGSWDRAAILKSVSEFGAWGLWKKMENFSGNVNGTGGLVTMIESNWLMSIVIARQPHFPNQPEDVKIFWGYGLSLDRRLRSL